MIFAYAKGSVVNVNYLPEVKYDANDPEEEWQPISRKRHYKSYNDAYVALAKFVKSLGDSNLISCKFRVFKTVKIVEEHVFNG